MAHTDRSQITDKRTWRLYDWIGPKGPIQWKATLKHNIIQRKIWQKRPIIATAAYTFFCKYSARFIYVALPWKPYNWPTKRPFLFYIFTLSMLAGKIHTLLAGPQRSGLLFLCYITFCKCWAFTQTRSIFAQRSFGAFVLRPAKFWTPPSSPRGDLE